MSQEFDPYHRWLGIPPNRQPANHYRLLGLVQFESDVEAIRDAAERQIAHVRIRALKHPDVSQKILNELASAKACLLDPEAKAAYDDVLRRIKASKPKPKPARASSWTGGTAAKWGAIGGAAAGLVLALSIALLFQPRGAESPRDDTPPERTAMASDTSSPAPAPVAPPIPTAEDPRRPPKLATIADQVAETGKELIVKAALADRGGLAGQLRWRLVQGAQWGANIDSKSGLIKWTPQPNLGPGKYPFTVQVASEEADELADRVSFAVEVRLARQNPGLERMHEQQVKAGRQRRFSAKASDRSQPPSAVVAPPTAAARHAGQTPVVDLTIAAPSGRKLTAADWDVKKKADDAANELRFSRDSKVVHLGKLALCEYNMTASKLDGRTITFHPNSLRRCETYAEYRQGNRHGVVGAWNAEGQMEYWGEYERDKCHEFCCLFENDRPRIVLVCDHGRLLAAHTISDGKIAKSFASGEEALRDDGTRPLLEKINDFESRYQKNEVAFRSQVKRIVQSAIGQVNSERREAAISRTNERGARQKAGAAAAQKKLLGQ